VNPHQLKDAAAFLHEFRETPVVLDHLGCLNIQGCDDQEAQRRIAVWREGMQALAQLPHVNLKVSGLCSVLSDWANPDSPSYNKVKELTLEMIRLFGPQRCMFASNFPVDGAFGTPAVDMYKTFGDYCKGMSQDDRDSLFFGTATRFYRL
jgi:predicted TIM-barrel fold metal-dependent hydrolase